MCAKYKDLQQREIVCTTRSMFYSGDCGGTQENTSHPERIFEAWKFSNLHTQCREEECDEEVSNVFDLSIEPKLRGLKTQILLCFLESRTTQVETDLSWSVSLWQVLLYTLSLNFPLA